MKKYTFENREIRSFRIREKGLNFSKLFDKKTKFACFLMADLVQPSDRASLKDVFEEERLKLTFMSKKMINLWIKQKDLFVLNNLLKGNVIKIEPYEGYIVEDSFLQNKIKFIFNQNSFNLRFLLLNNNVYRKDRVEKLIERLNEGESFNPIVLTESLKTPLVKTPLIEGLVKSKEHYTPNAMHTKSFTN
jgi:disulfide oxidoreductase YuzD